MDDNELLELAAKAAGVKLRPFRVKPANGETDGFIGYMTGPEWVRGWFDPLTDDGDALRLAVKLRLAIDIGIYLTSIDGSQGGQEEFVVEHHDGAALNDEEACAATRRAIVRAAAMLAKDAEARG